MGWAAGVKVFQLVHPLQVEHNRSQRSVYFERIVILAAPGEPSRLKRTHRAAIETSQKHSRVIDVDLTACFTVAQAAARAMVKQGSGRIINIGSIMGHVSRPLLAPYV